MSEDPHGNRRYRFYARTGTRVCVDVLNPHPVNYRYSLDTLTLQSTGNTIDISAFRPSRFAEGVPIKAEYEYKDD